ncbi:enoyl-CoA hydratase [Azospirillum canadense]|uniref:enoyl-CoA hydratase n=1 Tax=Azospirillum canadense TaxID=403962 RepID=UPI002227F4F5|nr:enoyl-CoA hydratase [Azospirillum canadense]MCW2241166.1 enoyl-CoA hydratase/carnithine racemase [Azospirillum canadense]
MQDRAEGCVGLEISGGIARLTLDQPRRLNAMTLGMWRSIPGLVDRAVQAADARVLLLRGAGERAFSAGADISEFATVRADAAQAAAYEEAVSAATDALVQAPVPTVAAVRGVCYGGGLELALCCDLRLGDDTARFRMPGARLGLGYAFPLVQLIVQRVGATAAADLLFSARVLSAADAASLGILQRVEPAASFDGAVEAYLGGIAANAPLTLRAAKRAMLEAVRTDGPPNVAGVDALVARCFASRDYAEGRAAFAQKREPDFRGE